MELRERVLVVDDDEINLEVYEELLGDSYELVVARDGQEALDMAQSHRPGLILLDIMMPGINGYETCRRLRSDPQLRFCKVILVSAKAMASERVKGYEAGADDYVTKPFDHDEMLAKVRVFLRLKSAEEVDDLKTSILEMLSHETRTPLNGIMGPAEVLASEQPMSEDERRSWGRIINVSAVRLMALVEKVLLLSELRAGKLHLDPKGSDFAVVVQEVAERQRVAACARKVRLDLSVPDAAPVRSSADGLRILTESLLDQAVEACGEGGQVEVRLEAGEESTTLEVHVTGCAASPTATLGSGDSGEDGSAADPVPGLGMTLAKEIATCLGGSLECLDPAEGRRGCRVSLQTLVTEEVAVPS